MKARAALAVRTCSNQITPTTGLLLPRVAMKSTHPSRLAAMHEAVGKHWRATAWMLERTRPEDFGRHRATGRHERNDEVDDEQQHQQQQHDRQPLFADNWNPTFKRKDVRLMFHRLLMHTWDKIPKQEDRDYVERIAEEILYPSPSQVVPWDQWDRERAIRETYEGFIDGGRDPMGIPYAGRGEFQQPLYGEEDASMSETAHHEVD